MKDHRVKSSYCAKDACVEVTFHGDRVAVGNSREPQVVHTFSVEEWEAFLRGVKAGEFDLDPS